MVNSISRGFGPKIVLASVFLCFVEPRPNFAGEPASLGVDELVAGLEAFASHFDVRSAQYIMRFDKDGEVFDSSGKPVPSKASHTTVECARKPGMIFSHFVVNTGARAKPWEEYVAFRDNITEQRLSNGIFIHPKLLAQCYNYFDYTSSLFIDCFGDLKFTSPTDLSEDPNVKSPSDGLFDSLPRIIKENRQKYRLHPELEAIDGFPCHVMEWPGHDVIWIDAKHGFVSRKRRLSYKEGMPMLEWRNRDLFLHSDKFWLPKLQEQFKFSVPDVPATERPEEVKRKYTTRLIKIAFDPIPDDFFRVPIKDGERLLVTDVVRKTTYMRQPKGYDPVKAALADARVTSPDRSRWFWLTINGIMIGLIGMGILLWRRSKTG